MPGRGFLLAPLAACLLLREPAALQTHTPLDSEWFGAFSEGESSLDAGVQDMLHGAHDGWEMRPDELDAAGKGEHASYYHEAPSGGQKEAWQTHYPALSATGAWHTTGGGRWVEDYQPTAYKGGRLDRADWFDSSMNQIDGFGRDRAPDPGSPEWLLNWKERSVNTTLTCDAAGCTAETLLQAYDGATEEASHCAMSLFLHPTDFDDQYSGERLKWIRVNDQLVNTDCFPMINGCNEASEAPLYPCLQDLPLGSILTATGVLNISTQISETVDECPFEGHLLAAVPIVTCLVRPRAEPELLLDAPLRPELPRVPDKLADLFPMRASVPLRCTTRGCAAHASLVPDPELSSVLRTTPVRCLLGVTLYQTDFDGEEGTQELVEYLQVGGRTLARNVAPGKNPCRAVWDGAPLAPKQHAFALLSSEDVTREFAEGNLTVDAKITSFVDECAHDGYLLDGLAELTCNLSLERAPLVIPTPVPTPMTPPLEAAPPKPLVQPPPTPAPPLRTSTPRPLTPPPESTTTPAPTLPPIAAPAPREVVVQPEPMTRGLAIAPFGREDTGEMLEQHSASSQDVLVDAVENAQVAEIKRAVFRALTKLRAAQIKEFDTVARIESQALDEFNDNHHFRRENPLVYLHNNEPAVVTDRYVSFHNG